MTVSAKPINHVSKVSIGMPVYNGEPFLRTAIDSVLGQTYADYELIISDNASTDRTPEICQEYITQGAKIRYFKQQENKGGLYNFNFVLSQARGEYFTWVASDDVWDSRYLEELVNVLEGDRTCIGANGEIIFIDENNKPLGKTVRNRLWEQENSYRRFLPLALFQPGINMYFCALYRLVALRVIGMRYYSRFPFVYRASEYPTLFALAAQGKVMFNERAKMLYRIHPGQGGGMHEPLFMALYLEGRLLNAIVSSVRKGGGSWPAAGFAFTVALYARIVTMIRVAIDKIRHAIRLFAAER